MQSEYVQERLESLNEVDLKLCSLLKEASQMVYTFSELKKGNETLKAKFEEHIKEFFKILDTATSKLHREIELLDENIGTRLLPINVNKKALGQDTEKMKEQLELLRGLLQSSKEENDNGATKTNSITEDLVKEDDDNDDDIMAL